MCRCGLNILGREKNGANTEPKPILRVNEHPHMTMTSDTGLLCKRSHIDKRLFVFGATDPSPRRWGIGVCFL